MNNYHYVYRITNTKLNKHYYGTRSSRIEPSKDIGVKYFSSSSDIQFRDDQKNNPQNYKYTIVSEFDSREDAIGLEIKLHSRFNVGVNESFYNKSKQTSTRFDTTGRPLSNAHKLSMSKTISGRKITWGDKISKSNMGRVVSKETRDKLADANTGKILHETTKTKISRSCKSIVKSDEHRRNLSESLKGNVYPKKECPHCNTIGGGSAMIRYHFDNCKMKQ